MEKYLGNKSKLADQIFQATRMFIDEEVDTFFDVFSGTTNVGRKFRSSGYNVISNDINHLSYVLGKCYLESKRIPTYNRLLKRDQVFKEKFSNLKNTEVFRHAKKVFLKENKITTNAVFLEENKNSNYINLLIYLSFFANEKDYDFLDYKPYNLIQKNYCEFGENSAYINLVQKKSLLNLRKVIKNPTSIKYLDKFLEPPFDIKDLELFAETLKDSIYEEKINKIIKKNNVTGNRKFFSIEHGRRIDIILNLINYWKQKQSINENEFYILLTSLVESVAIFSNTSATYQAFYKTYRTNTKQIFRLLVPEITTSQTKAKIIQEDAYSLVPKVKTDILYLDPPYNWRQYDSNYHLLNTISRYHQIKDISKFEKGIVGASGENRIEKSEYTSYHNGKFKENLLDTIMSCKARYVVLSYSNSDSNHKGLATEDTIKTFEEFFSDKMKFSKYKKFEISSTNFESRKGNKKIQINELLFLAKNRISM